jgi:hypothetical protein
MPMSLNNHIGIFGIKNIRNSTMDGIYAVFRVIRSSGDEIRHSLTEIIYHWSLHFYSQTTYLRNPLIFLALQHPIMELMGNCCKNRYQSRHPEPNLSVRRPSRLYGDGDAGLRLLNFTSPKTDPFVR